LSSDSIKASGMGRRAKKGGDYNRRMTPTSTSLTLHPAQLLGGLTPERFLAEYWQKKPLLVRGAAPGLENLITRERLFELAASEDMESRLVSQVGGWDMQRGPFATGKLKRTKKPWTVLVQGVNLALPEGDQLMRHFDFIPYARLDDLMVSYAVNGGGVGPHFDNYDVFLLQGMGRRRWRIGKQKDQTLIDGLPVRILKHFKPTHDWVLEPGDMLYLPPEWAHDGVAQGECMTLSVGFRTPPAQELADQFLTFLQDRLCLNGRYADPGLKRQAHPAEIGAAMIDQVAAMLDGIQWNRALIGEFLGASLTEPKPHVYFDPPQKPLAQSAFVRAAAKRGLALDLRSQMLFLGRKLYLNGEPLEVAAADVATMQAFADRRSLPHGHVLLDATQAALYDAYCNGFIHLKM
jgi:50S ribosomal protein L16 3-hydroxylase